MVYRIAPAPQQRHCLGPTQRRGAVTISFQLSDALAAGIDLFNPAEVKVSRRAYHNRRPWRSSCFVSRVTPTALHPVNQGAPSHTQFRRELIEILLN